jgi:hypothetical protein
MIGAHPMRSDHRKRAALVLGLGVAGAWQTTSAAEFDCRHGDLMRRVEVNTGDAVQNAACEVRYWRNASAPGDGEVLWRANQDLDFCDAKARDLLARLEAGGWTCTASDAPGDPEALPLTVEPAADSEAPPSLALTSDATQPAPAPGEPEPGTTARVESSAPIEPPAVTAAARIEPAAPTAQAAPGATAGLEPANPAEEPAVSRGDNPHATVLDQVVQQTLRSVQQMYGGDFRAEDAAFGDLDGDGRSSDPEHPDDPVASRGSESAGPTARPDQATLRAALARDIQRLEELTAGSPGEFATDTATLGDLNGDGLEDAAVLLTHRTEDAEPTYYLLAYVFNGATFQPVARINLEAYYRNFTDVGIEDVAGGAVDILLQVPRADDPQCCPSGRRQATFGLRDGQLVLLKESEPGA